MSLLRCVLLLQLAAMALGQPAHPKAPTSASNQPKELVQRLYQQVVAHPPKGMLGKADLEIFAPLLSKTLLYKMDLAKACSDDWDRNSPDSRLKEIMASAYGLFSGDGYEANPRTFRIQKTQSRPDGSLRVYVELTSGTSLERPWTWRVAAVLVREDGQYVLNDVIYVNSSTYYGEEKRPPNRRLSEYLSAGCNGSRWAGYTLPNEPKFLVRSLYQKILDRPPVGIPTGVDWKFFAPYLSKSLMHQLDLRLACTDDWDRQNPDPKNPSQPDPNLKPPVLEMGIFSGGDERTGPRTFRILGTQSQRDGSVHVDVKLAWWETSSKKPKQGLTSIDRPMIWRVAPILVKENSRLVVDDVIFLKDETRVGDVDWRLSETLASGCDGPHWVGRR